MLAPQKFLRAYGREKNGAKWNVNPYLPCYVLVSSSAVYVSGHGAMCGTIRSAATRLATAISNGIVVLERPATWSINT